MGIMDNVYQLEIVISLNSFSKFRFLKLASFNEKGSLDNVIIQLL